MKRTAIYASAAILAAMCFSSCWKDEVVRAGADRHQASSFSATAGDECVALEWSLPEGILADDFIIRYTDENSETVTINTGAVYSLTVSELKNDLEYKFSLQAVYGKLISGEVFAKATPRTTRIAVAVLEADAGNHRVALKWEKPDERLLDYTLAWWRADDVAALNEVTVPADATSWEIEGLENDFNYTFRIVANYDNGKSEPCFAKAMPSAATIYFLSQTSAAKNQPIQFRFNTMDIPTATNISWTFPDGKVLYGPEVSYGISSTGTQNVILRADVEGTSKSWTIELEIREYVVSFTDMDDNGDGFKAVVPVCSPDGKTVYALTYNNNATLFAWDVASGELKWKYATGQKTYNGLCVNPVTGDIYFGTTTAGNFFCLDSEGNLRWTYTGFGSMQSAFPTTNADGSVVYAVDKDGKASALNAANGSEIWTAALGKQGGGILVNGDEVLFGLNTGGIATLVWLKASDGSQIASIIQDSGMTEISGFALSADRRYAYYSNKGGGVSKVDLQTRSLVVDRKMISAADLYEPVVSPNGDVFVGSKDSHAYCLDGDLKEVKWTFAIPGFSYPANNAFNYSHPCSDTKGNFYISSGQVQCNNFIITPAGAVKESWQYGSGSADRVMAGTNLINGVYYTPLFNSANAVSAFMGKYVGGERYDGHGTDICGNCIAR